MRIRRSFFLVSLFLLGLATAMWPLAGWNSPVAAGASTSPIVQGIIDQVDPAHYRELLETLSGVRPTPIGGQEITLRTRYTQSSDGMRAEQYMYEYFQSLGLPASYESWSGSGGAECRGITGRNIITQIPGKKDPGKIYIMSAHLDSISPNPDNAPGADDDGTGTVALMVAAEILRNYSFDYTVRLVSFTGEERGLCGSSVYAQTARSQGENIAGDINLDMVGYDSDGVKDIELHAGTLPGSRDLATQIVDSIRMYAPSLVPHVYYADATDRSDHASFWRANYPALTVAENFFHGDPNPYYHGTICCDTIDHVSIDMATGVAKATIATLATLGGVAPGTGTPLPASTRLPTLAPTFTPTTTPLPSATPIPTVALPAGSSKSVTFPETGKQVSGIFLDYWEQHGGLAQQGYPISGLLGEVSDLNGKPYTVQYFERAVFEYHPENAGTPYEVLLSQLGTLRYKEKYPGGAPGQQPNIEPGSVLFKATGHAIGGKFLQYWQTHGGLMQQGYPISDEFTEVSPLDGKPYTVQYFERAVFELHPENAGTPYEVLLSQLGTFRYKEKHGTR